MLGLWSVQGIGPARLTWPMNPYPHPPNTRTEHQLELSSAAKIDPTSSLQLALMHTYYSHNQAAVDFWLRACVLPAETQQYPWRLAASSWHLADNARGAVGSFARCRAVLGNASGRAVPHAP